MFNANLIVSISIFVKPRSHNYGSYHGAIHNPDWKHKITTDEFPIAIASASLGSRGSLAKSAYRHATKQTVSLNLSHLTLRRDRNRFCAYMRSVGNFAIVLDVIRVFMIERKGSRLVSIGKLSEHFHSSSLTVSIPCSVLRKLTVFRRLPRSWHQLAPVNCLYTFEWDRLGLVLVLVILDVLDSRFLVE